MSKLQDKLNALPTDSLRGIRRGVEKRGCACSPPEDLALTPHPKALGSALTHPLITTDYSESQLELITGAHLGVQQCMDELTEVHQFAHYTLKDSGGELLWAVEHAVRAAHGRDHSAGPLWRLQRIGPRQERVPHGPGPPLWPAHADHFGHPLQLVAAQA